ncbi:type III polyketide synthase [Laceyella putida]|uniref:Type III polyketide synthase n=1 Tax=Laceyella putida TaxID=110101 RepID=A0ABW2RQH4_9BACL
MPRIIAVGTAVPPYVLHQTEARTFAGSLFGEAFPGIERLLKIFENTAIDTRHVSKPLAWFEEEHSVQEKNQAYIETACRLGTEAVRRCLAQAGCHPTEIDHLLVVSTTGLATPSLDARLINQLGLRKNVKRTPIWGLGCAGGAAGLRQAAAVAKAWPTDRVLLVAVECCSLTFRRQDHSKSNLVATSLFGDGAAAVLVSGEARKGGPPTVRWEVVDAASHCWPDSLDVMGWDFMDDGMKVIFSRDIPTLIKQQVKGVLDPFLASHQLTMTRIDRLFMHPGGKKVLEAYEEALGMTRAKLAGAYEVLKKYGNMSSPTVLFVLEQAMRQPLQPGEMGLLAALGPGFSLETVLLQAKETVE